MRFFIQFQGIKNIKKLNWRWKKIVISQKKSLETRKLKNQNNRRAGRALQAVYAAQRITRVSCRGSGGAPVITHRHAYEATPVKNSR